MLKTLLSATLLCFACMTFTGCTDDGVEGDVDDYGGVRENAEKVEAPGAEDGDGNVMQQDQGAGGGG